MGEVAETSLYYVEELPLTITKTPQQEHFQVITIESKSINQDRYPNSNSGDPVEFNPQDSWLPITQSRNGNIYSAVFHLLSSGIGFQALLLPVAFATLGWTWGIICLSIAYTWQLYTIWLLVQLPELTPGTRYSRYLHLSTAAFGPKLGKLLAIFPVMYLSGGSCVMLIITGGGNMEQFFKITCGGGTTCEANSLTSAEWFLIFTVIAILVAQLPNLNSIAKVSAIGAITAVTYFTLIWVLSIVKGRTSGVSYDTSVVAAKTDMVKFTNIFNAIGIIALAFRGHNLILEIQGTLPSRPNHASSKTMWRGVTISYVLIAMCLFPLAIGGFWAYGNKIPAANGGVLGAIRQVHRDDTSKIVMGVIYLLAVIHSLSSFQIYAMPVFDNLEMSYTIKKKKRCPRLVRTGFRLFFGGLVFFIAVAFPFLGSLAGLIGGIALPLTYVYPCFMWILMKKPRRYSGMWWINLGLGCLGLILSVVLVVAAVLNLADKGLHANFFRP